MERHAFSVVLEVCVRAGADVAWVREELNCALDQALLASTAASTVFSWRPGTAHRFSLLQLGLNSTHDRLLNSVEYVTGFVELPPESDATDLSNRSSETSMKTVSVRITAPSQPNPPRICVFQIQAGLDDPRSMLGNGSVGAESILLPCADLDGLFDTLIFPPDVKERLLAFVQTAMHYSRMGVNSQLVNCNRTVLLHGPPGTGKTTLAKALAHKIAVRHSDFYSYGMLVEVNAHSVFSKYFSESGKLVQELFANIKAMAAEEDTFVCVLLDEVESITAARQAALSGSEPSDAIRVVNAVLTQIDQLQHYPNILLIATTNVTGAIDLAFLDRADIKQHVGLPSLGARYHILQSCIKELIRSKTLQPMQLLWDFERLTSFGLGDANSPSAIRRETVGGSSADSLSLALLDVAYECKEMSGRTLRKLPFLAHAFFVRRETCTTEEFIAALRKTAESERTAVRS